MNPLQFWSVNNLVITGILALLLIGVMLWWWVGAKLLKKNKPSGDLVPTTEEALSPKTTKPQGKFPAYVWREETGIKFERIEKPLGQIYIAETTMPHPGACYFVMEKDGELKPYNSLDVPLPAKGEGPKDLFRLLKWPEVSAVYTNIGTLWDKINMLLPWVAVGGLILVLLVGMDKLTK